MQGTIQKYTLDMADGTALKPLIVKQGDTNSRFARISLVAFKEPWTIPFGCQIHINVHKNDGTYANATCTQEDEHTVLAPITEQMTAVPGTQLGELFFLGADGDIRSQTFPLVVWDAVSDLDRMVSSDDFQALKEALRDVKVSTEVADIAAQYATEQGNSARDGAQRANDAADSIQVAVDAAAAAKECESNAKDSETAAAQTQQAVTDYVEAQKAAFVGYSQRESDSKYANALTETATGEGSITVEDAWTAPVLGLEVTGKSEQVATTGAQLFDIKNLKAASSGTWQVADNGKKITVIGTNAYSGAVCNVPMDLVRGKTITLSGTIDRTNAKTPILQCSITSADGVTNYYVCAPKTTVTLKDDDKSLQIYLYANNTLTSASSPQTAVFSDVMLNYGDTPLPWEPYTGGASSPSPDYPQDIISTGTVSTGAQLLNADTIVQGMISTETGAESESSVFVRSDYIPVKPGDYILSGDGLKPYFNHVMYFNQEKLIQSSLAIKPTNGKFTVADETAYIRIRFISKDGTSGTVTPSEISALKPMLNAGDTALSWEPYTGGKPSPSVEYPQTLEVTATGAQLFDASKVTDMTAGGATVTNNGDGSFTVSGSGVLTGKINRSILFTRDQTLETLRAGNYCMSGNKTYPYFYFTLYNVAEKNVVYEINTKGTQSKEITQKLIEDENLVLRIGFYGMANESIIPGVVWPMVNAGDTALPWEPYQSKSASITLTEPLRGIGEYRDRIMRRDGVWGIERCVDVVDNGQWKKINVVSGSAGHRFVYDATDMIEKLNCMVICSKYTRRPMGASFNAIGDYVATDEVGKIFIRTLTPDFETAEEFREFMADAITIYPLAAPVWEPLPDATQQALNELTTYAGTTHLTITAGGPAPTVTLEYVKDTHKALEQCQEAAKEYTDTQIAAIVAALPTATQAAIVDNQTTRLLQEA